MLVPRDVELTFDRGTLLYRDPPDGALPGELPGTAWDARVAAWRAPARFHAEIVRSLVRRGVRFSDSVRSDASGNPDSWSPPDLRPYQQEALEQWLANDRRGVIVLPTGSGKTRTALAAAASLGCRTLCLVPTRPLLDQWVEEIARCYRGPVGRLGDGAHEIQAVTVATYESAWRWMPSIGNRFDLLVVDEAHHFGTGFRDEALEMSIAGARIGLTGTPAREGSPGLPRLSDLVGPVVYQRSIGDLAGRYLAEFEVVTLGLDLDEEERRRYERWMGAFRDVHVPFSVRYPAATWLEFVRAASRTAEGRRALEGMRCVRKLLALTAAKRSAVERLLRRHAAAKVLVFTGDNQAAYEIARRHRIMPMTCDIGRRERTEALARFRSGELRSLVSSRVLNEGLDVPDADVGVVVGGQLGEREHAQRIGRLLRPSTGKRAVVYELVTRRTLEVRQAERRREGLASARTAHS